MTPPYAEYIKPVTFMLAGSLPVLNCLEVITFKGSIVGEGFCGMTAVLLPGCGERNVFSLFGLSVRPKMIYADVNNVNSTLA